MLWGGVRPYEVTRLTWKHIDLREKEIIIPSTHSKTGSGRHIDIYPSLYKILVKHRKENEKKKNMSETMEKEMVPPTPKGRVCPLSKRCATPHIRQLPRKKIPQPPPASMPNGAQG